MMSTAIPCGYGKGNKLQQMQYAYHQNSVENEVVSDGSADAITDGEMA